MTYFPGILSNGSLVAGLAAATVRNTLGLGTADSPTFFNITATNKVTLTNSILEIFSAGFGLGVRRSDNLDFQFGCSISQGFIIVDSRPLGWANSADSAPTLRLYRGGAGILQQRNETNAQISEVFKTYTSETSNEGLRFNCAADISGTPVHRIESFAGSLGGSVRILEFGRTVGTSFVSHMVIREDGGVAIGAVSTGSQKLLVNGNVTFNGSLNISASNSGITINRTGNDPFILLQRDGVSKGQIRADANGFKWTNGTGSIAFLQLVESSGNLGVGVASPTAAIHIKAGTATAGTAPIKLTTGVNLTTPEAGAVEYDGTNLYFTDSGGTRRTLAVV